MKTALRFFYATVFGSFSLFAKESVAQCNTTIALFQSNVMCSGDDLNFMGYVTGDCPMPNTVQYSWTAVGLDSENNPVIIENLTVIGNVPGYTNIPVYVIPFDFISELNEICLNVNILDEELNVISTTQQCISSFQIPEEMVVVPLVSPNWCGDQICLTTVTVDGGVAPYAFYVDGEPATPNFGMCYNTPGVYMIEVVDANGCFAYQDFVVETNSIGNGSCESAQVLESGVAFEDTICSISFDEPSCLDFTYYLQAWYTINSGNATHMNIGFFSGYYGNLSNMPFGLEIYTSPDNTGCSNLELMHCHDGQLDGDCFDLADFITIEPNTDYYIRPVVQWTSINFTEIMVVLSDAPIDPICGCTDSSSCNFDPEALINDGSCGYNGCTDPGACNYLSYATCDDGSCIFGSDITGQIFHDLNGNGLWDYWNNEAAMGNGCYIYIQELDVMVYPNSEGSFVLPSLSAAVYHVEYVSTDGLWILAIDNPIEITLPTCTGLLLPVIPASEAAAQISGNGWFWNSNLHCTNGFNIGVYVQNTGTVPLSGQFSMSFDPSLTISEYVYAQAYTNSGAGFVNWSVVDQPVGSTYYYMVHVNGPGVEFVGSVFTFEMHLTLEDNNEFVFYDEEWTHDAVVTCAYDPNDKQAIPEGYADQHFILGDEEIEYKVRFQNTGNAPAFDVIIEDQIDISKLDLSTFEPVIASHSYSTIIQPDGMVKFVFNNIMLPDSASDEPGSQGYVVYRIRPLDDLMPGDVIENTADIFFDDNPAIQTNTTFHTIFSCDWIQPDPQSAELCVGDLLSVDGEYQYIESYSWLLNGNEVSDQSVLEFPANEVSQNNFSLVRTNPLCSVEDAFVVQVNPNPEATITMLGDVLTASDGVSWQWFHWNEALTGATNQTLPASGVGYYNVEVTNEFGCTTMSDPFIIISVDENNGDFEMNLYPNPASGITVISSSIPGGSYSIYDLNGKLVLNGKMSSNQVTVDTETWNSGMYTVLLATDEGCRSVRLIVE